jgi:hypothetical protein
MDFLYVPAAAAPDWTHLAHHFWRHGVMVEVAMPQMVYLLAGPGGMQSPHYFNVVDMLDMAPFTMPLAVMQCTCNLTDGDAAALLRKGDGIYMPRHWVAEPDKEGWREKPLTWMHAYKMHAPHRQQAFREWWSSLPCLQPAAA